MIVEKKFDYQTSLHLIKSGLFDIYENQEKILGTIEDEKIRNSHLDDFINLKNIAINKYVAKIVNIIFSTSIAFLPPLVFLFLFYIIFL